MNKETLRMRLLSGVITESEYKSKLEEGSTKESLNENFVGMGMVGNIFDREKTDYEIAFEHFTKGTSLNEVEEVEEDQSPSDNTGVDHYFDFYISNKDTQVELPNSNKKVNVPSGTVIRAIGGGVWKSLDSNIKTNINSLKGNSDFDVVNNTIWPDTMDLVDEIEAWARSTNDLIQKDPKNIQKIIDDRAKVIASIKNMI